MSQTEEARALTRDEALSLNRQERGRDLYDGEIDWYLADCQTPIRHGTASLGVEIAAQLRDRLAARSSAVVGEYASCERTHATGTTHYHPLRVKAAIDKVEDARAALSSGVASPEPHITTLVGTDDGPLGHAHLWFCQCSDPSIPRHVCGVASPEPGDDLRASIQRMIDSGWAVEEALRRHGIKAPFRPSDD